MGSLKTPWGKVAELRRARLPPGPQPGGPEATRRHQTRRLYGATVAVVAAKGYANAGVNDLARAAGVSETTFHRFFESKEQCFLGAVDELYDAGIRRITAGYGSERQWERRVRAGIGALIDLMVEQPAAARMCVVNVYEAGVAGSARVEAALRRLERLLRVAFGRCRHRSDLPPAVIAALVGGIHMTLHDRLRLGREAELRATGEELLEWLLSYTAPPRPPRRPRRRVAVASPPAGAPPSERLSAAFAAAAAERGYWAVRLDAVAGRASTSLRTFYEAFGSKEGALLACLDRARDEALSATTAAYESAMPDWPRAVGAANEALLAYLAAHPDLARLGFVEAMGAGPAALKRRDEAVKAFAALLGPGMERSERLSRTATEAIAFGAYRLVQRQIVRYGPASLPRIGPTMTFFDLAPFLGAEAALRAANG